MVRLALAAALALAAGAFFYLAQSECPPDDFSDMCVGCGEDCLGG